MKALIGAEMAFRIMVSQWVFVFSVIRNNLLFNKRQSAQTKAVDKNITPICSSHAASN